jgi:uncharacterized protein (TIGR02145 family)
MDSFSTVAANPYIENYVKDAEGNRYRIALIGQDYWMAENLRTTHFNNGDPIPTTTPATLDITGQTNPYYWSYNGDRKLSAKYGLLYNNSVINDNRGICPTRWHVPTYHFSDYYDMEQLLGIQIGGLFKINAERYTDPVMGFSLTKILAAYPGWPVISNEVTEWDASNTSHPEFINFFGFSLLPGGERSGAGWEILGGFKWEGTHGTFWAEDPVENYHGKYFYIFEFWRGGTSYFNEPYMVIQSDHPEEANYGSYIRCKKD